jgi:hypothetical protein
MASMMRWINLPDKPTMDEVMASQTLVLRSQMSQIEEINVPIPVDSDDPGDGDFPDPASFLTSSHRIRRSRR